MTATSRTTQSAFWRWLSSAMPSRKGSELAKFMAMMALIFLVGFNYNLLRASKDAMVVPNEQSGVEVIPFIKLYAILPAALLATFAYTWLSNRFSREAVFGIMVGGFITYFFAFAFILYPYRESLQPHETANWLETVLPTGLHGGVAMIRYWVLITFYVVAEIWSALVLSVLFWGFANEVTTVEQGRRYYGWFAMSANIASVAAGWVSGELAQATLHTSLNMGGEDAWHCTLVLVCITLAVGSVLAILVQRYIEGLVHQKCVRAPSKKEKVHMGLREIFKYLANSPYLLRLALIVICFNLTINLVEVTWKEQVYEFFGTDKNAYMAYMGSVGMWTGIASCVLGVLMSAVVLPRFSWSFSAMLTPAILLITSIGFFACLFLSSELIPFAAAYGTTPLFAVVFLGGVQNVMCRAGKYTMFDPTKEMAFVPLSAESRQKGKAAIDGVGSRLGKSGGSFLILVLLQIFGTVGASSVVIAGILFAVLGIWLLVVLSLGRDFNVQAKDAASVPEGSILENG